MTSPRVRAPELTSGGDWFNTAAPLTLASLRGRFVVLDFWTFACANCLHVLDELRPLEAKYRDILTVVGIHSPKFAHEAEPAALGAAIERYGVHHPVLNDPELRLWQQYAVRAWPTLALIDPEGYVIEQAAGEGQVSALDLTIASSAPAYRSRGHLQYGDGPFVAPPKQSTSLRFPAKAVLLPAARTGRAADSLLVADAGHHQLTELALDGETVLRRIGSGARGRADGPAERASFAEPNGLALLPEGVAQFDVVVADTANHLLRGVRLSTPTPAGYAPSAAVVASVDLAAALAGWHTITGAIPAVLSPWDVVWWPARSRLVVAAAGVHLLLGVDPVSGTVEVLAGTTVEGLRDGPALDGWLAQPSGLAVDGERVWFVDAETSALRYLSSDATLHTVVGEGLFDFGHVDGPAASARLQHPLGVSVLPDGSVAVLDTYNGAVRRYDESADSVSTLATDLAEPSGAVLVDGELVVIESAAHRLVRAVTRSSLVAGPALRTLRPVTLLRPGAVALQVDFTPPPGRKRDERFGLSTQLTVSATPPELLLCGAGESTELGRALTFTDSITEGVLHVTAKAASCDDDPATENPACYLSRQDWGVPVQVTQDGASELQLMLLG